MYIRYLSFFLPSLEQEFFNPNKVVQDALVARWFSHDKQITLSVSTSFCEVSYRASSFLSMGTTPLIYHYYGFSAVLWFTFGIVLLSMCAALVLVGLDRKFDDYLQGDDPAEPFSWSNVFNLGKVFWML